MACGKSYSVKNFSADPHYPYAYAEASRRHLSQVFVNDRQPLQLIGPSPLYDNSEYTILEPVGMQLSDFLDNSFFFDFAEQALYVKMAPKPGWFSIEVGVRAFALRVVNAHDVVIRGLQCRHNRHAAMQGSLAHIIASERITVENCKFELADFRPFDNQVEKLRRQRLRYVLERQHRPRNGV